MSIDHSWEKLNLAVNSLARSTQSLQKRLATAYIYNLSHLRIEELPEEMRDEFQQVRRELTKVEPIADEGRIAATTNEMSDDEAGELISRIVSMYDAVVRELGKKR